MVLMSPTRACSSESLRRPRSQQPMAAPSNTPRHARRQCEASQHGRELTGVDALTLGRRWMHRHHLPLPARVTPQWTQTYAWCGNSSDTLHTL